MKFGGAALADGAGVRNVCRIVAARSAERPGLVVSAHAGVTEMLDEAARGAARGELEMDGLRVRHRSVLAQLGLDPELLDQHLGELRALLGGIAARRRLLAEELDYSLSFGERMSARVVAAALRRLDLEATPVDAFDLGLTTDSVHGRARPLAGFERTIRDSLADMPGIPVVTGFLGRDASGKLTTLGRNGSDLTAALLAEASGARELIFFKCVAGVSSADPKLVPEAHVIERLDFEEARELALHGASVLHPDALPAAERSGALVRVLDVDHPDAPGTLITARSDRGPEDRELVGIASESELHALELVPDRCGELDRPLTELFALLGRHRIEPRFLRGGPGGLTIFSASSPRTAELAAELDGRVRVGAPAAVLALVGRGGTRLGARATLLLEERGIPVRQAFLSDQSASQVLLVAPADQNRALRALHAGFLEPARAR